MAATAEGADDATEVDTVPTAVEPAVATVARVRLGAPNAAGPDIVAGPPPTDVPLIAATAANIVDVAADGTVTTLVRRLRPGPPNAAGPDIVAGRETRTRGRHVPQPQPGVPAHLVRRESGWLVQVRCCRYQRCQLCRHRRRTLARPIFIQGRNGDWPECGICLMRVPITAMVRCANAECGRAMCIMCMLRYMAAKNYREHRDASGKLRCAFCRELKSHTEILLLRKYYRTHRMRIRHFVPTLWRNPWTTI